MKKMKQESFKNDSERGGFIRIIIILVVLLVVLGFLGYNIDAVWSGVIVPIFAFIGNIIFGIANWLIGLLRDGWDAVSGFQS